MYQGGIADPTDNGVRFSANTTDSHTKWVAGASRSVVIFAQTNSKGGGLEKQRLRKASDCESRVDGRQGCTLTVWAAPIVVSMKDERINPFFLFWVG